MLEPYQHHTSAKQKIHLVSSDYVAREIAAFRFETLFWPAVFEARNRPSEVNDAKARLSSMHDKAIGHTGKCYYRESDYLVPALASKLMLLTVLKVSKTSFRGQL